MKSFSWCIHAYAEGCDHICTWTRCPPPESLSFSDSGWAAKCNHRCMDPNLETHSSSKCVTTATYRSSSYTSICYICIYIHTSSQCTHTPQCGEWTLLIWAYDVNGVTTLVWARMGCTTVVPCRNDTHNTGDHSLCIVGSADYLPTSLMALDP